ncbi:MAG: DUF3050 domain-containing protein, partial [Planctomycetota bacterium]
MVIHDRAVVFPVASGDSGATPAAAHAPRVNSAAIASQRSIRAARESRAAAAAFVRRSFAIIDSGSPHRIVAAFTYGREDVIPEM